MKHRLRNEATVFMQGPSYEPVPVQNTGMSKDRDKVSESKSEDGDGKADVKNKSTPNDTGGHQNY